MNVLLSSKLFHSLSPEDIDTIQRAAVLQHFGQDEQIFQEGDEGDGLYVVHSGVIEIAAVLGPGDSRQLSHARAGEFFGEMAVVDEEPRSATATARQDCSLYFIPREAILEVLNRSPKLAANLVREFSQRMRDFNRHYLREVVQAERLAAVGRFARSIVHDFKNPLNVIGIAADIVAQENAQPQSRRIAHQTMRKQIDRLCNMTNELMEFTRGSHTSVVLSQTNYREFVENLLPDLQAETHERSVELTLANPPPDIPIALEPKRLSHVLFNLIHNAVDAMPNGGTIQLSFRDTPKHVITELSDSGPGISEEIFDRLFEPFATHGKTHGTGLGLSICRKIIEDHKGTIRAANKPEGGACFVFTLPRS